MANSKLLTVKQNRTTNKIMLIQNEDTLRPSEDIFERLLFKSKHDQKSGEI